MNEGSIIFEDYNVGLKNDQHTSRHMNASGLFFATLIHELAATAAYFSLYLLLLAIPDLEMIQISFAII